MAKTRAPPPPNPSRAAPAAGESTRWFQLPLTRTAVKASSRYNSLLPPHSRSRCLRFSPSPGRVHTHGKFYRPRRGPKRLQSASSEPPHVAPQPSSAHAKPKKNPRPELEIDFPGGGGVRNFSEGRQYVMRRGCSKREVPNERFAQPQQRQRRPGPGKCDHGDAAAWTKSAASRSPW